MNQSSFDRCRIDNVDLHTDLMMLYDLAELAPLPGEPQTVQHPCIEHSLRSDRRPVPGSSCAVRAFRPAQTRKCSWNPDPTHSGGDRLHNWPCITFSTLSTAARGLEAQECLKRLAGSYSNLRELQRDVQIQTHDRRCCCPLPLYQTGPRNGRFTMVHG